jgi:hypothetical protein
VRRPDLLQAPVERLDAGVATDQHGPACGSPARKSSACVRNAGCVSHSGVFLGVPERDAERFAVGGIRKDECSPETAQLLEPGSHRPRKPAALGQRRSSVPRPRLRQPDIRKKQASVLDSPVFRELVRRGIDSSELDTRGPPGLDLTRFDTI